MDGRAMKVIEIFLTVLKTDPEIIAAGTIGVGTLPMILEGRINIRYSGGVKRYEWNHSTNQLEEKPDE